MKKISLEAGREVILKAAMTAQARAFPKVSADAKFWKAAAYGGGGEQAEYIVQYKIRESDLQKEQRVRLTNPRTGTAIARCLNPLAQLKTTDKAQKTARCRSAGNQTELDRRLGNFHGDRALDEWLFDTFKDYAATDPNAALLLLFDADRDESGFFSEKPRPRATIVPSDQIVQVGHDNGHDLFLLQRTEHSRSFKDENGRERTANWEKWALHFTGFSLWLEELTDANTKGYDPGEKFEILETPRPDGTSKNYAYTVFATRSPETPFIRFGAYSDPLTGRETKVSILEPARQVFNDLINRVSEYGLTMALHTFLQKFEYVRKCGHRNEGGFCDGGRMSVSKHHCPNCKGTGKEIHSSVQDVITITLPETKEEFFPIRDMVSYVDLPFGIVKHLKEEIADLQSEAETAVWGIPLQSNMAGETATAIRSRMQSVYNRLGEIGAQYSRIWEKCVRLTAAYAELGEVEAKHLFPTDFNMLSAEDLADARKKMRDAGVAYEAVRSLDDDILDKLGESTPEVVRWERAKRQHRPFRSKTDAELSGIVQGLPENNFYRVLWTFFDEIFTEVENAEPGFPEMVFDRQKETVKKFTEGFQKNIPDQPVAQPLRAAAL